VGFLGISIACQIVAFSGALALNNVIPALNSPLVSLGAQSLGAAALARWSGVPPVWQLFNLVLPPAVWGLLLGDVPIGPIAFIGLAALLLYLPTFWTRVPYYPTSAPTYAAIAALLPTDRPFRLLDIGCGFAPLLRYLARERPNGNYVGVEISPLAFFGAWLRSLGAPRVTIRFRSFWKINLGDYDVVYAFLAPGPMPAVWDKVVREMRPSTVFISNTFPVPAEPDEVHAINDARGARLYIYRRSRRVP
jgi:SAM-dependent methyltransferase